MFDRILQRWLLIPRRPGDRSAFADERYEQLRAFAAGLNARRPVPWLLYLVLFLITATYAAMAAADGTAWDITPATTVRFGGGADVHLSWRWMTSWLVHASSPDIVFVWLALLHLGRTTEQWLGARSFVGFLAAGCVVGGFVQILMFPTRPVDGLCYGVVTLAGGFAAAAKRRKSHLHPWVSVRLSGLGLGQVLVSLVMASGFASYRLPGYVAAAAVGLAIGWIDDAAIDFTPLTPDNGSMDGKRIRTL